MNNRLITLITMGTLVFMLAMGSSPVTSSTIVSGEVTDVVVSPNAQSQAPVFYSIAPEMPSEYGYLKGTEVNISYLAANNDTPWLMGSGNGLDWSNGTSFPTSSAFNTTFTLWSINITLTQSGQFKGRTADDVTGTNAIWENHPDGPTSNWNLKVIGDPIPDLYNIVGATYFGDNGDGAKYFAKPGTTVTIITFVVNFHNASADFYLVGALNESSIGGAYWDITNKSVAMSYYDFKQVTPDINVTYYSVDITMPDATFDFKIASSGSWVLSESGSNNVLSNIFLQFSQPTLYDVQGASMEMARVEGDGGHGAQYRAAIDDNVSFWYQIYSLNTCNTTNCMDTFSSKMSTITLELQGDDAGVSLGWIANDGQLPFTFDHIATENLTNYANITSAADGTFNGYSNFTNVQVAYFYINYTVKVETTQFKGYYFDGAADRWEGPANSANNALVAGLVWSSDLVGDVYNAGSFQLSFTGSFAASNAATTDTVGFGIWDGSSWAEYNSSGSVAAVNGDGTWTFTLQISTADLAGNNFVAGADGNAQIILYHYDLGLLKQVKQYDPQGSNAFTVADALPTASLTGQASQGALVSLNYTSGDALNSTVDTVVVDWADGSAVETLSSLSGVATHTYTADGAYTVKLTATSVAGGETTATFEVTVDSTAPTAAFSSPADQASMTDKVVEFKFSFADTNGSGVASATLDYGDGSSDNVLGTTSSFHTYTATGDYTVKLTVVDEAGNSITATLSITIAEATTSSTASTTASSSQSPLPVFFLPTIFAIFSVGIILKRRR